MKNTPPWSTCGLLCVCLGCGPAIPGEAPGTDGGLDTDTSSTSDTAATTGVSSSTGTTSTTGGGSTQSTAGSSTTDAGEEASSGSSGAIIDPPETICERGHGPYDLAVEGLNLGAFEGARVWVVAIEPADNPGELTVPTVLLSATVTDGTFFVACAQGLAENSNYPSLAIIVDADGDGACSDDDQTIVQQLFGWASHQTYTVDGERFISTATRPPWIISEEAWTPASVAGTSWGVPLCDYYPVD